MAYTTGEAIGEVLTPLTGTGRTAADLPQLRLEQAADDASTEIDLRLAGRYVTPVEDDDGFPPDILAQICRDIGAWLATLEARGGRDLEERDPVKLRYDRAVALLDAIAAGHIGIPDVEPVPADTGGLAINTVPDLGLTVDVAWTPQGRRRADYVRVPPAPWN